MPFQIGQEVECTSDGSAGGYWWPQNVPAGMYQIGPASGDILHITSIEIDEATGETYLLFAEWPEASYFAESFRAVPHLLRQQFRVIENPAFRASSAPTPICA